MKKRDYNKIKQLILGFIFGLCLFICMCLLDALMIKFYQYNIIFAHVIVKFISIFVFFSPIIIIVFSILVHLKKIKLRINSLFIISFCVSYCFFYLLVLIIIIIYSRYFFHLNKLF